MITKKYKVEGMHCTSCSMLIESNLEDIGVKAKCNFARETLEVEIDTQLIMEEKIIEIVKSSGYIIS